MLEFLFAFWALLNLISIFFIAIKVLDLDTDKKVSFNYIEISYLVICFAIPLIMGIWFLVVCGIFWIGEKIANTSVFKKLSKKAFTIERD